MLMNILNLFQNLPNSIKIFFILVLPVSFLAILGMFYFENSSELITHIKEQKKQSFTPLEIDIRLQVRNANNQEPIPKVKVELDRVGSPINDYTDDSGYYSIKIPNNNRLKLYLSKDGFEKSIHEIDPTIKDRNITFYLQESRSITSGKKEENSLPSPESKPNSRTQLAKPNNLSKSSEESEGFQFDIQDCSIKNHEIICHLQITSMIEDSPLRMYGFYSPYITRLIDTSGQEYNAKHVRIGTYEKIGFAQSTLIKDTPINSLINFGESKSVSDRIKTLELCLYKVNSNRQFKIQFHNIPIRSEELGG